MPQPPRFIGQIATSQNWTQKQSFIKSFVRVAWLACAFDSRPGPKVSWVVRWLSVVSRGFSRPSVFLPRDKSSLAQSSGIIHSEKRPPLYGTVYTVRKMCVTTSHDAPYTIRMDGLRMRVSCTSANDLCTVVIWCALSDVTVYGWVVRCEYTQ